MEHCEICGQQVAHTLRSTTRARTGIVCSGTSCGGRIVHAKCANLPGPVVDALAGGTLGLFWLCDRCRRHPERRPLLEEKKNHRHQELTELSAIRALAAKMVESVDENLNHVKCLMGGGGSEKEDKTCQWPEEEEPELPTLPAEIWLGVFQYFEEPDLLRVRSTCRRFRDLLEGCSALREKFLPRFPKGVRIDGSYTPKFLFPAASNIFFGNAKIFAVGSWWGPFGRGLTEINLSKCKCVLATLLAMLRETPNLREMLWNDIMMDTVDGSEVDFHLDKMEKFIFKGKRDAKMLAVFEKLCPNLKILTISSDDLDDYESDHAVSFVESVQNTLESLQITCTDCAINGLLKLDRLQLKQLVLDGYDISDNSVAVEFCRKIPSLKSLHLQDGFSLRGSDLKELGESLPNLECLSAHFPPQTQIVTTFLASLPVSLRHLALAGEQIEGITIPFTAATIGQGCPNLTQLALKDFNLAGDSLRQFAAKTPLLTSLALETVAMPDWPVLYAALAELTRLQQLNMTFVNTLAENTRGDEGFAELPAVKSLIVKGCNFTKKDLISMLGVLPHLRQLELYNMELVDDGVVAVICRKSGFLKELKIIGCALTPKQEQLIYAELGSALNLLVISEGCQHCN
uniref:F-box domain-containing protein n=1 Tax=Culex tarsalis TaxID=7177 RepID=A0A1Q3EWW1_CULTA